MFHNVTFKGTFTISKFGSERGMQILGLLGMYFEAVVVKVKTLLHFVAFFHVASLFSTEVDNKKGGVDNVALQERDSLGNSWRHSLYGSSPVEFWLVTF